MTKPLHVINWQGQNYTRTTIKLLNEQLDNDTVTA